MTNENRPSSPYDVYETDNRLETDGRWVVYPGSGEYLIRRAGGANVKYNKQMRARMKPYRDQKGKLRNVDEKVSNQILMDTFIDTILMDWKEVYDREGNEMEFNKENAYKLFTDLPILFQELVKDALDFANFRRAEVEMDLGE